MLMDSEETCLPFFPQRLGGGEQGWGGGSLGKGSVRCLRQVVQGLFYLPPSATRVSHGM